MFSFLFFIIYNIAQIALLPAILAYFIWRKIKKKSVFGNLKQRLGFVPCSKPGKPVVWIHAVSVGETLSTEFLVNKITANGNAQVYSTYGTLGAERVAPQVNSGNKSFIPYDFFLPMFICFLRIKPHALIIIEAERWPNLMLMAKLFHIPCFILNGRITNKKSSEWIIVRWFIRTLYRGVKHIYAQSEYDVTLFQQLGIPSTQLSMLGNIKAANVLLKLRALPAKVISTPFFILMAGSIHPTEDTVCLETFTTLKPKHPNLKLLLVPRHFHWIEQLREKLTRAGDSFIIVQEKKSVAEIAALFSQVDVVVVAVLGIMFELYQLASIFLLGGTFVTIGGHNLLEPAVWAKGSIVGPHHQNSAAIAPALSACGALLVAHDQKEFCAEVDKLTANPIVAQDMGNHAYAWLAAESALVEKRVDCLLGEILS